MYLKVEPFRYLQESIPLNTIQKLKYTIIKKLIYGLKCNKKRWLPMKPLVTRSLRENTSGKHLFLLGQFSNDVTNINIDVGGPKLLIININIGVK